MINDFIRKESQRSNFLMTGDLNLPKIDWKSNTSNTVVGSKENNFLDALADSYLTQHTIRPTRIRGDDKPSLVDLVLRGTTIPDELDVNEKWLFLKSKITKAKKKFIPELSIKSNKNRRYTANRDILELVRKKKRL